MVPNRGRKRWRPKLIPAVYTRVHCVLHVPPTAPDDLASKGPGPMLSFISDAQTSYVQVDIRNQRGVVLLWSRGLAEKVSSAHVITAAQLPGDSKFIEKARFPVQR